MTKPSVVFAHGLWADGSCFGKLIPTLQAEGYEVMASQHGLDSLATDVAAVKACLARARCRARGLRPSRVSRRVRASDSAARGELMRYRLTCLTPTLVGDGRKLSPIDYMVWKDHVNVLDQWRIFRLLAKGPRLEGYLAQLKKADKLPSVAKMWPATEPYQPTVHDLHQNGRLFPPNYLHESWMDYLYWDSELEA